MKHTTWKWFVIRRFLLILVLVSLSESLLNIFYRTVFYPWLEQVFHINFFMAEWESEQTLGLLFRSIVFLAVWGVCSRFPYIAGIGLQGLAERLVGSRFTDYISAQTSRMSQRETQIYLMGTAVITLLVVVTMILPYVIAALVFGQMVEAHVRQLEEQELRQKEEYDRRRNLLLSDVAHDLKTPMTTVAGYAKALLENKDISRQEYLEPIYHKTMQMSGLINLLFEYVKLDSEGYQLKKAGENIWELLRESAASLYMDFERKEMEVLPEIPEGELWMQIDRLQFQRVISNLLNNAIRHNKPGTKVLIKGEQEDGRVTIRVCDNGEIIPEETAKYIFEPFVSGDESRRSKGGSGLGLSIAHKVIAMHGGSLRLEQEPEGIYRKSFVICLDTEER